VKLPDLPELLGAQADARRLALHSRAPARQQFLGQHRSVQRGRGLEFEEVRPYVPGDDARSIDWRVSARRGRLHTKLFREERERPVWLLVDLQPAMFFGSQLQLKSALAVRTAAVLAWVSAIRGDRVGAVIANGAQMICLPPRAREAGVLPIINALLALQPRAPRTPLPQTLAGALTTLQPMVHPGSLVLAISDFAAVDAADEVRWSGLAAHAEVRLFCVSDALERNGLPDGKFRGGLPGRLWPLDGRASRARWQILWREREQRLESLGQRLRMRIYALDTGVAPAAQIAA
jgi:uncharacterized protein (DUF58 family)